MNKAETRLWKVLSAILIAVIAAGCAVVMYITANTVVTIQQRYVVGFVIIGAIWLSGLMFCIAYYVYCIKCVKELHYEKKG